MNTSVCHYRGLFRLNATLEILFLGFVSKSDVFKAERNCSAADGEIQDTERRTEWTNGTKQRTRGENLAIRRYEENLDRSSGFDDLSLFCGS